MSDEHDRAHRRPAAPAPISDPEVGRAGRRPRLPPLVQRRADGHGVGPRAAEAVSRAAVDPGAPLPAPMREKFEASLGTDLGDVRVHSGPASGDAARSVRAKAYTTGQDIHFGLGAYAPETPEGERLLAHEVAHTVQQGPGAGFSPQFKLEVSSPGDAHEVEADRAADEMVRGAHFRVSPAVGLQRMVLQREEEPNGGPTCEDKPPPTYPDVTPINWEGTIMSAEVIGGWGAAASFPAADQSDEGAEQCKQAFEEVFAQAVGTWNQVSQMAADLKSMEAGIGGLTELPGQSSSHVFGQGTKIAKAFDGDKVGASLDQDKLSADDRTDVVAPLKTVAMQADVDVQAAATALSNASLDIANAGREAENALISAKIANLGQDVNAKTADKSNLELRKQEAIAGIQAATLAAQGITNVAVGVFGGNPQALVQGAVGVQGAIGKAIETDRMETFNAEITKINGKIVLAQGKIAALSGKMSQNDYESALAKMQQAANNAKVLAQKLDVAKEARKNAYMKYGNAMKKLAGNKDKGGLSEGDATKIGTAIEGVPQMEQIVTACGTLSSMCNPPAYNEAAGRGAALATNSNDFLDHVGVLRGYKAILEENKTAWGARLKNVKQQYMA